MPDNTSDDANPYGITRPSKAYQIGSRIPKTYDWKPPRSQYGEEPRNTYYEESDPASPQGIPRPNIED